MQRTRWTVAFLALVLVGLTAAQAGGTLKVPDAVLNVPPW